MLFEMTVALFVLLVALGVGLTAWHSAAARNQAYARRAAAREAVTLALERVRALDTSAQPKPGQKLDLGLPPELIARLPGGRCEISASAVDGAPELRRVRAEVRWTGSRENQSSGIVLRVGQRGKDAR